MLLHGKPTMVITCYEYNFTSFRTFEKISQNIWCFDKKHILHFQNKHPCHTAAQ